VSKYFVRTIEKEPVVTIEESELISALPVDKSIDNSFPFDDSARNKLEVYKVGLNVECKEYIKNGLQNPTSL
jgi:hypothetical protein